MDYCIAGGRYALGDVEAARECIQENRILRRLVPELLSRTMVVCGLNDEDVDFSIQFL
jgi:glycerol-3-phosphate dehydrogenase